MLGGIAPFVELGMGSREVGGVVASGAGGGSLTVSESRAGSGGGRGVPVGGLLMIPGSLPFLPLWVGEGPWGGWGFSDPGRSVRRERHGPEVLKYLS